LYQLDLTLVYADSSTSGVEINTIAGIYVGGGTDFDVAFSETTADETTFTIANTGSNPAFSVALSIPSQDGWSVSGTNSMIIGNLDTGDYTVAGFDLSSSSTSSQIAFNQTRKQAAPPAKSNTVKVQIAYTDTRGTREIIEKEVSMQSSSLSAKNSTGMPQFGQRRQQQSIFVKYKWYIIGAVALVLLSMFYIKYKRQKMIDPDFHMMDLFRKKDNQKEKGISAAWKKK
jgi:hypothetical protein